MHRDIKPENILLSGTKDMTVKLADFGLAKNINTAPGVWELTTTLCGTPSCAYPCICGSQQLMNIPNVAPEILEEGPTDDTGSRWTYGLAALSCTFACVVFHHSRTSSFPGIFLIPFPSKLRWRGSTIRHRTGIQSRTRRWISSTACWSSTWNGGLRFRSVLNTLGPSKRPSQYCETRYNRQVWSGPF